VAAHIWHIPAPPSPDRAWPIFRPAKPTRRRPTAKAQNIPLSKIDPESAVDRSFVP
jgi:hypothetical protein